MRNQLVANEAKLRSLEAEVQRAKTAERAVRRELGIVAKRCGERERKSEHSPDLGICANTSASREQLLRAHDAALRDAARLAAEAKIARADAAQQKLAFESSLQLAARQVAEVETALETAQQEIVQLRQTERRHALAAILRLRLKLQRQGFAAWVGFVFGKVLAAAREHAQV